METFKLNELLPGHDSPYAKLFAKRYKDAQALVDQDSHFFAVRGEPYGTILANSKGSFKTPLRIKLGTKLIITKSLDVNNVVEYLEKTNKVFPRKSPNGSPRKRRMKRK